MWNWIIIAITLSASISCGSSGRQYMCEEFDLSKLPFDSTYFFQPLNYTDGIDTLKLNDVYHNISKKSEAGNVGIYVEECLPTFGVNMEDKHKQLRLGFFYQYYPLEDNEIILSLNINFSNIKIPMRELKKDTLQTFPLGEKCNLSAKITRGNIVKSITIKNLRIIEIENMSGYLISEARQIRTDKYPLYPTLIPKEIHHVKKAWYQLYRTEEFDLKNTYKAIES